MFILSTDSRNAFLHKGSSQDFYRFFRETWAKIPPASRTGISSKYPFLSNFDRIFSLDETLKISPFLAHLWWAIAMTWLPSSSSVSKARFITTGAGLFQWNLVWGYLWAILFFWFSRFDLFYGLQVAILKIRLLPFFNIFLFLAKTENVKKWEKLIEF
jgi:hypothetical protein